MQVEEIFQAAFVLMIVLMIVLMSISCVDTALYIAGLLLLIKG